MTMSITKWIADHRKLFLASWFVIAVVMISPAVSSIEKMDMTLDDMDDSYSDDMDYYKKYFDDPELNYYRMPIIVINYWNAEGYRQIQGDYDILPLSDYIIDRFTSDDKWKSDIDLDRGGVIYLDCNGDTDKGSEVLGILFKDSISDEDIGNKADALRASVEQYKEDYIYELYEKNTYFDVHVAGNAIVLNDVEKEFDKHLIVAIIVVAIFVLLMMGLFFGSVITAVISALSMAASAITTLAMIYFITAVLSVPYMVVSIVLIMVMILSFAHSIMTFSFYRNELMNGNDKDTALTDVLERTSRILIPFLICLAICCIALMCTGSKLLLTFGLCTLVGLIILALVSTTFTISMMNITKNELEWVRIGKGPSKWKPVRAVQSSIDRFFSKVSDVTGRNGAHSLVAIGVVLIVLVAGSIAYIAVNDSYSKVSFDTDYAFSTGDSKEAIDALVDNSIGGMTQPYMIVVEYDSPIAYIVRDNSSTETKMSLHWYDTDYYKEIRDLENRIYADFSKDVFDVSSMECWDILVQETKAKYPSLTGHALIEMIIADLAVRNAPASIGLQWTVDELMSEWWTADEIINYGGPRIDYSMNYSTGAFGYHMNVSSVIVVDRIMIEVFMSNTATSSQSMSAAEKISSAVSGFVSESSSMSDYRTMGATKVCTNITKNIESRTTAVLVIIGILIIIAMAIFERNVLFTVTGIVVSVAGFVISSAIIFILSNAMNIGDMYFLMPFIMLLSSIVTCVWFDLMQCSEAKHNDDVRTMKRCVDPIIIITSGSLIIFAVTMIFTDVSFIYQLALTVMVTMLIQGLIMRIIISPHLWTFARLDLSRLFKKSDE